MSGAFDDFDFAEMDAAACEQTLKAELRRVRAERDTLKEALKAARLASDSPASVDRIVEAALASVSAEENTRQDTETTAGESART